MVRQSATQQIFRFAPSPNGYLHLGHAYSALLNQRLSRESGGELLLRIEDIDRVRCLPKYMDAIVEDLAWLGIEFPNPVLRQSDHFAYYGDRLKQLIDRDLAYPCFCSRKDIAARAAAEERRSGVRWPRDPDGAPLYTGTCRALPQDVRAERIAANEPYSLRLNLTKSLECIRSFGLIWRESGKGDIAVDAAVWGDVILARKDTPASYHLCCVLDDDRQNITDVVRGADLFAATAIQRVLQELLGLSEPRYLHHPLLTDEAGQKLAKSKMSTPLRQLRAEGVSAGEVRRQLGF